MIVCICKYIYINIHTLNMCLDFIFYLGKGREGKGSEGKGREGKGMPNQTTSASSRKPNSSCFLSKICSLTSWQLCSKWWNSSHKFDKDVLLYAFWNILNESSKEERARKRQIDELILERMRRTTRAMHSNLAQLKFASGETSSEGCKESKLLMLKHMVHQQNPVSMTWCTVCLLDLCLERWGR